MPLEEMPNSVRDLYRYDPDKAKRLLAEAGYPDGFKTKMVVLSTFGFADMASVYKAMWAKIGVEVELQPREVAVFNSIAYSRAYEEMVLVMNLAGNPYPACLNLAAYRSTMSLSFVNDPVIDARCQEIQERVIVDMPGGRPPVPGVDAVSRGAVLPHTAAGPALLRPLVALAEELPRRDADATGNVLLD